MFLYLLSGEKRNEEPICLEGFWEGQGGRKWVIGPAMLVQGEEEVEAGMRKDLEVVALGAQSHPIRLKVRSCPSSNRLVPTSGGL